MPYFITDKSSDCSGWAVTKQNGDVIGCHKTKQSAIKQMVAVSLVEKMKPGGERALNDELEVGDFVFWENAGQTEYGLIILVSTYGVVTDQLGATVIATQDRPIAKISVYELVGDRLVGTDRFVIKSFAPLTKLEMPDYEEDHNNDDEDNLVDDLDDDMRIDVKVPAYMRAAARRGLQYVSEGKAGDGLKQQTINEARKMAAGEISDDKWIRMAAWIARHLGDLDSPEADPQHPNYPSAGVVAHLLWGSGPSKTKARAAMEFAQGVVERIRKEEERHLAGKHDQSTHGRGGGGMGRIPLDEETVQNMQGGSAQAHLRKNADGSWGFTPEREALHDQIVSESLAGIPASSNPTVVFLGGGAASGKSTALAGAKLDINEKHATINPDNVKKKLPEYKQKTAEEAAAFTHEESSYVAKRIQAAAIERKNDIVLDAVGDTSAANMEKKINAAKAAGYRTIGTYVTIPTAEAQVRAYERGIKEGRVVPPKVIAAGHRGVSNTFPQIASKFDEVALYNNEIRNNLRLIGSGKNGSFNVEDQELWTEFLAKGSE